jgi:uracil-DNA glycosylase family 4
MNKKELLDELKKKMEMDESLPLKKGTTNLVFGVGNSDAEILYIGEGPGYWEDLKAEPFVGNAGKLLDSLLQSIKLPREEVYITNVVHHRPLGNRDPLPEEIAAYGVYLDQIIEIIGPRVIVTLGRFSMGKFLSTVRISGVHGKKFNVKWKEKNIVVVPMYHPAAALRNGEVMRQIKEDFLELPEILKEVKNIKEELKKPEIKQMELV